MNPRIVAVLVSGGLIMFLSLGTRHGFGLFLGPVSTELVWDREVYSIAIAIQNLVWGLSQPFTAALADRYGTGRVGVGGTLLYLAGLLVMAETTAPWQLYLGTGVLFGLGLSAVSFAVVLGAVARAIPERRRATGLGIASAGASLGQFILLPAFATAISAFDWRVALIVICAVSVIMAPLFAPLRGKAADFGMGAGDGDQTLPEAVREARGHRGYWFLVAGFFVCGFQITFIGTHLPAYVADQGLADWVGVWALALIGLFNIVGTFACGALGDRYRKKYLLSLLYLGRAVLIAALMLIPPSPWTMLIFAGAIGALWLGTVPLTSGLVAQIFGVKYMATLFGFVFLSHQIGAGLGVWLGGRMYDLTGTYDLVWAISIALGVLATLLHWPIADRPVARLAAAAARG